MLFYRHKKPVDFFHSDYLVLSIGLVMGAVTYFILAPRPALQAGAVMITGLFYILWGTIHHAREGDLHMSIIIEYTLIAGLAMALLLTLIFRT